MKKVLMAVIVAAALFLAVYPASAWTIVGNYGDTGWQTYSHTFDEDWSGEGGFLVSNDGDMSMNSVLLVDNINFGSENGDFEYGDLTGFVADGDVTVVESFTAHNGTVYSPTEGDYMVRLLASGVDTSAYGGTNGAFLWLDGAFDFTVGDEISFDWAFLAMDYMPFEDFSLFLHSSDNVQVVEFEELGKIGAASTVPEPASISLLGLGLFGLARRFRRKV